MRSTRPAIIKTRANAMIAAAHFVCPEKIEKNRRKGCDVMPIANSSEGVGTAVVDGIY